MDEAVLESLSCANHHHRFWFDSGSDSGKPHYVSLAAPEFWNSREESRFLRWPFGRDAAFWID
jgi:hypothetical protein